MKIRILILFIILFGKLYPAFEIELSPKIGISDNFTDSTKQIPEPKIDLNLKLGYNFIINFNKLRSISLLFDTGADVSMISIYHNNEYKRLEAISFYTGASLKFILNSSFNEYADFVFGLSSGAKYIPIIDDFKIKTTSIPISPYIKLDLETRIYKNDYIALITGIQLSYEYMFFNKNDTYKLFNLHNVKDFHSFGFMFSIGIHYGKRQLYNI